MQHTTNRILAISLSTYGFGYAVLENKNQLIEYGKKRTDGGKNKNTETLKQIEKTMNRFQPDHLVLHDVNAKGTYRGKRIKQLHERVVTLAKKRKLKTVKLSNRELRLRLLDDERGTKEQMAAAIAERYPEELKHCLPPHRTDWESEDPRMNIFDAVGLAVARQG